MSHSYIVDECKENTYLVIDQHGLSNLFGSNCTWMVLPYKHCARSLVVAAATIKYKQLVVSFHQHLTIKTTQQLSDQPTTNSIIIILLLLFFFPSSSSPPPLSLLLLFLYPLSSSLSGITTSNSHTEQSVVFDHNTVILLLVSWHMSALYISQGATFCLHPNLFFCHIYCVQTVVLFWLSVYYGRYLWYKFQLLRFRCQ